MAVITLIQSVTGTSTASPTTAAFTFSATAGSIIVVSYAVTPNTASMALPTDTIGNSYRNDGNGTATSVANYLAVARNKADGANTVTVTSSGSPTACVINVREYISSDGFFQNSIPNGTSSAYAAFVGQQSASSGTAVTNSVARTPSSASALIIGTVANSTGQTFTAGAGFANLTTVTQGNLVMATEDLEQIQPTSQFATFTQSSTGAWSVILAGVASRARISNNNYNQILVGDGMSSTEKVR